MSTDIEAAEAILAKLKDRRSKLFDKSKEISQKRVELAYDSQVTPDGPARKQLDRIVAEAYAHDAEINTVEHAIVEATDRLQIAVDKAAAVQRRLLLKQVQHELDSFVAAGAVLDGALQSVAAAALEIDQSLRRLHLAQHSAGLPSFPEGSQLDSLGYRALLTVLSGTIWRRNFEVLGPTQRRRFGELLEIWRETINRQIGRHEAEAKQSEEIAA